nr:hypothetical protein [Paraburkholderia sp. BL8N3]
MQATQAALRAQQSATQGAVAQRGRMMVDRNVVGIDDRALAGQYVERDKFFFTTDEKPAFVATHFAEDGCAKHSSAGHR